MITPANGGGQAAAKAGKEGAEEKQVKTETEEKQVKMAIQHFKHEKQVKLKPRRNR